MWVRRRQQREREDGERAARRAARRSSSRSPSRHGGRADKSMRRHGGSSSRDQGLERYSTEEGRGRRGSPQRTSSDSGARAGRSGSRERKRRREGDSSSERRGGSRSRSRSRSGTDASDDEAGPSRRGGSPVQQHEAPEQEEADEDLEQLFKGKRLRWAVNWCRINPRCALLGGPPLRGQQPCPMAGSSRAVFLSGILFGHGLCLLRRGSIPACCVSAHTPSSAEMRLPAHMQGARHAGVAHGRSWALHGTPR